MHTHTNTDPKLKRDSTSWNVQRANIAFYDVQRKNSLQSVNITIQSINVSSMTWSTVSSGKARQVRGVATVAVEEHIKYYKF